MLDESMIDPKDIQKISHVCFSSLTKVDFLVVVSTQKLTSECGVDAFDF